MLKTKRKPSERYTLSSLEGKTIRTIADILTREDIPTPAGKKVWSVSTIRSILSNEKYKGCALLQKTFTVDFLTKTSKANEGEVLQYYVENSPPAIIDPETWDLVQNELKKRSSIRHRINNSSPFAAKIICGECGGFYGSKVWHSADQYRTHIWQCNRKYKNGANGTICGTPHLREGAFKAMFVEAFNQILGSKEEYIRQFKELLPMLADTTKLEEKRERLVIEQSNVEDQLRRCIEDNAKAAQDQDEYKRRYSELAGQFSAISERVTAVENKIQETAARREKIRQFLHELKSTGHILEEFDENLWNATVDSVVIRSAMEAIIAFRDGTEIAMRMPQ